MFGERGVHVEKGLIDKGLCSDVVDEICSKEREILMSKNTQGLVTEEIEGKQYLKYIQCIEQFSSSAKKIACYRLIKKASELLGSDDLYFSDYEAHIRNPGGSEIPYHQDNFYFNLKDAKGLTCYVSLDGQNKECGGLQYLLRSHKERVIEHEGANTAAFSSALNREQVERKNYELLSPEYGVGDASFHHPENIHFARCCPKGNKRSFALSVRVFDLKEVLDRQGRERYLRLLEKNRGT